MQITDVKPKPYLKLRIFATLIDYTIYGTFFWYYVRFLGTDDGSGTYEVHGWLAFLLLLIWFIYFPGTEMLNSATPGHDILGLKVIKSDGNKIDLVTTLKRRICDPLDIGIWGLPAVILINKTDKHQRIGDILAGTLVVKKEDITEREISFE